jgi:carboxymethylenebutenolidase
MKFIITSLLVLFAFCANSQQCCEVSSTGEFASLSDDPSFVMAHDEPVQKVKFEGMGATVTFPVDGGEEGGGYIIRASKPTLNWLVVIHEWWGLNDHIRAMGEQLNKDLKDCNVLCLDLYDGLLTDNREQAAEFMQNADEARIMAIIDGAKVYMGHHAKVSTIGWCFGGGWSLQASIAMRDQGYACVMYYGMPEEDEGKIAGLQASVLGIFASEDGWVTGKIVQDFESNLFRNERSFEIVTFEAEHAFANPSNPNFDKKAAKEAYEMALSFLSAHMEP